MIVVNQQLKNNNDKRKQKGKQIELCDRFDSGYDNHQ